MIFLPFPYGLVFLHKFKIQKDKTEFPKFTWPGLIWFSPSPRMQWRYTSKRLTKQVKLYSSGKISKRKWNIKKQKFVQDNVKLIHQTDVWLTCNQCEVINYAAEKVKRLMKCPGLITKSLSANPLCTFGLQSLVGSATLKKLANERLIQSYSQVWGKPWNAGKSHERSWFSWQQIGTLR